MQIFLTYHWQLILQVIGILILLLIVYLNFFSRKTPTWLANLVDYLNFRHEDDIQRWLIYSKYFKNHEVKWLEGYCGKREDKELFFGLFELEKKEYFCAIIKDEVKPMILTSQLEEKYDWEFSEKIAIGKNTYNFFASEKFLLDNIKKSANFQLTLGEIFKGKMNVVEFTELNQVVFISDRLFETSKEGIEFFSTFIHLKDEL